MVDYYALPQSGGGAWPGRAEANTKPTTDKPSAVELAVFNDVSEKLTAPHLTNRFIPFVLMHEFEGLLFSDCNVFAEAIGRSDLAPKLKAIRDRFNSPEEINDSPVTAPSKRIEALIPNYQKPLYGSIAAIQIGLHDISAACPHFAEWLKKIESLAS